MNFFPPRFVLAKLLRKGFDISAVPCRFPSCACCALDVRPTRHRTTAAFRTYQKGNWAAMGRLNFRRPRAIAHTVVERTPIDRRNQPRHLRTVNVAPRVAHLLKIHWERVLEQFIKNNFVKLRILARQTQPCSNAASGRQKPLRYRTRNFLK